MRKLYAIGLNILLTTLLIYFFYYVVNLSPYEVGTFFFFLIHLFIFSVFSLLYCYQKINKTKIRVVFLIVIQIFVMTFAYYWMESKGFVDWFLTDSFQKKEFSNKELVYMIGSYNSTKDHFARSRIEERIYDGDESILDLLWIEYYNYEYVNDDVINILFIISKAEDKRIFPVLDQMLESEYDYLARGWYERYFDKIVEKKPRKKTINNKIPIWK